jgi:hypothetical protein
MPDINRAAPAWFRPDEQNSGTIVNRVRPTDSEIHHHERPSARIRLASTRIISVAARRQA